jgi:hypothetical protein
MPSVPRREDVALNFHRCLLRVLLTLGVVVLTVNAYRVLRGNAWLFAAFVQ